ncbi:053L [Cherax quadricarinatus iridovirus]|uniref:N1R p28 n=1 Tax=Shrimp hemocyte iridescent virus TaxID=2039780 RepID=A0A291B0T6_9VIRU|nr:053L [Cherax quadricarinatus iridovirus]YP_010084850.1 N1R p28 [Shrimp hemocyte iridescent virus]UPA43371.1 N1R p28 [Iridovirus CN01]ASZ85033.1 053L [Cherax quadricarinatus iridovirus]ATE87107.1 N1R p28 [Shrimp hemocyte iridescent virus]UPA43447.1 N1R p28 [Iridovirus CN01]UPA43641.1 N1R p28 [Iridovirus CN01]
MAFIFEYETPEIDLDFILSRTEDEDHVLSQSELMEMIFEAHNYEVHFMGSCSKSKNIALTPSWMKWLECESKTRILNLLKSENIPYRQIKFKDPEFVEYPDLVKENMSQNAINKKQWIVMKFLDFKEMVLCLKTRRAKQVRRYYLALYDLYRLYDEYVRKTNERLGKDENMDLINEIKNDVETLKAMM